MKEYKDSLKGVPCRHSAHVGEEHNVHFARAKAILKVFWKKKKNTECAQSVMLVACKEMMAVSHVPHGIRTSGRNGEMKYSVA